MHKHTKGCGTLEKRNGTYLARWTVNGKRFTRSTGTGNRQEAERVLAEITAPFRLSDEAQRLAAINAKIGGIKGEIELLQSQQPGILIADAWRTYETAPERPDTCGEARHAQLRAKWQAFTDFMAETFRETTELRNVTREHVAAFLAGIEKRASADTYNQYVYALRQVWRVLAEIPRTKVPRESPLDNIAHRRVKVIPRRALTADEMVRVCADVTGEMRVLLAIGVYTGLRLGDAATLEWGSVDTLRGRIDLIPGKTARHGTAVTIPIHPALLAVLTETPPDKRAGCVLPETAALYRTGNRGRCLLVRRIRDTFRRNGITTECDAPDNGRKRTLVGFHSLRHSAVSLMANAGAPLAVVQRIVGHTTSDMTSHYFHATDAALIAAVDAMPDVLGTAPTRTPRALPDATRSNVDALCAIADRMSEDELEEALAYIRKRIRPCAIEATATTVHHAA